MLSFYEKLGLCPCPVSPTPLAHLTGVIKERRARFLAYWCPLPSKLRPTGGWKDRATCRGRSWCRADSSPLTSRQVSQQTSSFPLLFFLACNLPYLFLRCFWRGFFFSFLNIILKVYRTQRKVLPPTALKLKISAESTTAFCRISAKWSFPSLLPTTISLYLGGNCLFWMTISIKGSVAFLLVAMQNKCHAVSSAVPCYAFSLSK